MIDKLDLRVPGSAFFSEVVTEYLREATQGGNNPRVRGSQFYQARADLRPLGVDAQLHYRYRKHPHDSKLELFDVGKKAYSDLVKLISCVVRIDADELGIMRIDLCADILDVPVLWFQQRARFNHKRRAREYSELKYGKIGSGGVQTITSGQRPNLFRIYDKPAECLVQFKKLVRKSSPEADELDFEKEFGFPKDAFLTRVERQIGGDQVPEQLSFFGVLHHAPDFNPFTPMEIIEGNNRVIPTIETVGLSEWLQGTRLSQLAEEMGMQLLRPWLNRQSPGNANRIMRKYESFFPSGNGGISTGAIYEIYRESARRQLAS